MTINLDEISKLLGEITQGDWVCWWTGPPCSGGGITAEDGSLIADVAGSSCGRWEDKPDGGESEFKANGDFIAAAPTIIRDLVERVRLLEDVLGRCETLADNGVDDPAGPYNVLQQVVNTICAVLYAKEHDDD